MSGVVTGSSRADFERMAARLEAMGCTADEVERVEADQGVQLPPSYRDFLETMGRDGGGLFGGTDVCYPEVIGLRRAAEELIAENESDFALPVGAVVFAMLQGYQFMFLDGADGPDPAVQWWIEGSGSTECPEVIAGSLFAYLEGDEQSQALPPERLETYRRGVQAERRLRYSADACPECGGSMKWMGKQSWIKNDPNNGRAQMLAHCPTCGSNYWRWADLPDMPLQRT